MTAAAGRIVPSGLGIHPIRVMTGHGWCGWLVCMNPNLRSKMSTQRWGCVVVLAAAVALAGCGSNDASPAETAQPAGANENVAPGGACADRKVPAVAAICDVEAAYGQAESSTATAFAAVVVVPKLERWQATEERHQAALIRLRDRLPEGECRTAIEKLLIVEEGQNVIRRRLIENYRQEQFGLVAKDATDYGVSVVAGAIQAEEAVAVACGRSTVNPARVSERAAALNPGHNALVDEVLKAYEATRQAFGSAFSRTGFAAAVEALQAADAKLRTELEAKIASLPAGPCRDSLVEILEIEKQQEELRVAMIEASNAGNTAKMFTILDEYTAKNSTSPVFVNLRSKANLNCGGPAT